MATFVLIPGAGGNGEYWDELVPELESRGHDAIPVDIRARDALDAAEGLEGFGVETHFLHDLSPAVKAAVSASEPREPSDTPFGQPCAFERWPGVPIHVVVGRDDRFFPADFQTRVAKGRLGVDPDVIPGGHLVALANPSGLAELLVGYLG